MTRERAGTLSAHDALALFALAYVLYIVVGGLTPASTVGLVIQQVIALAVPAFLFARARGLPIASSLGCKLPRPSASAFVAAALIGLSFWYLNLWLVETLVRDPAALERVERELGWTRDPVMVRLFAIAILPAVCEELLLRGAITRALGPSIGVVGAVVVSSLLFASLHLPPVRMIPAGAFGLVLAYTALATDSVLPCILMHFLNNLVVAVWLPAMPEITDWMAENSALTGTLAATSTAVGMGLLWRSRVAGRR